MIRLIIWVIMIVFAFSMLRSCSKGGTHLPKKSEIIHVAPNTDQQEDITQEEEIDASLTPEEKLYRLTGERIDPVDNP